MKKITPFILILFAVNFYTSCKKSGTTPIVKTQIQNQTVSTFAGSGVTGSTNGTGSSASFSGVFGVAADAKGNIYVADQLNCLIRKITPDGVVGTLAGSGAQGTADGTGTAASFDFPTAVAVDGAGNVYVADGDNEVRKITAGGAVSTLAGSSANFNMPLGIAADAAGNVYVADCFNNQIRKINPSGVVSLLAGSGARGKTDGTGNLATFNQPYGVAVDAEGNVFVADNGNGLIRKVTSAGVVTTIAGNGVSGFANGTGLTASFGSTWGITVDAADNVYVADAANNMIRKINTAGVVSTLSGSITYGLINGDLSTATFYSPKGVAIDATGNVYVADTGNDLIRKITL